MEDSTLLNIQMLPLQMEFNKVLPGYVKIFYRKKSKNQK